jgi:hypothetical protein
MNSREPNENPTLAALFKQMLGSHPPLVEIEDLAKFHHPLLDFFVAFNENVLHYNFRLVDISDQVFQFASLDADADVQTIFVIDILDWGSYNRYSYNEAFQTLLLGDEDEAGDDVEFYFIDLSTHRIIRVSIPFIRHKLSISADKQGLASFLKEYEQMKHAIGQQQKYKLLYLSMILKFSIKLLENIMDGIGKVDFIEDYIAGIEQVWDYNTDDENFNELQLKKNTEEPSTAGDDVTNE